MKKVEPKSAEELLKEGGRVNMLEGRSVYVRLSTGDTIGVRHHNPTTAIEIPEGTVIARDPFNEKVTMNYSEMIDQIKELVDLQESSKLAVVYESLTGIRPTYVKHGHPEYWEID